MIRYLIIDDEHIAHTIIEEYCNMLPNMQLKKNCYDALEALDYLRNHTVDLIFLDLNMPKLKGFDFLKTLQNPPKLFSLLPTETTLLKLLIWMQWITY